MIKKYSEAYRGRYVETTCTRFYISGSRLRNAIYPLGIVRNGITNWQRQKRKWTNSFRKRRASLARFLNRLKGTEVAPATDSTETRRT